MTDTKIVESRFAKAAAHYDSNAKVQENISLKLYNLINQKAGLPASPSIFEIGCGTGNLTKLLSSGFNPSQLLVNDLCKEYAPILEAKIGRGNFHYTMGDASAVAQKLTLSGSRFDIIASSSAIQWIKEPLQFINRCTNLLNVNGIIAFTTFLPDNLFEVNALCNTSVPVTYSSEEDIRKAISHKYNILLIYHSHDTIYFDSATDVLRHLKYTGVNVPGNDSKREIVWTRGRIREFENGYRERFYVAGKGYRLTYSPIFVVARKREQSAVQSSFIL